MVVVGVAELLVVVEIIGLEVSRRAEQDKVVVGWGYSHRLMTGFSDDCRPAHTPLSKAELSSAATD